MSIRHIIEDRRKIISKYTRMMAANPQCVEHVIAPYMDVNFIRRHARKIAIEAIAVCDLPILERHRLVDFNRRGPKYRNERIALFYKYARINIDDVPFVGVGNPIIIAALKDKVHLTHDVCVALLARNPMLRFHEIVEYIEGRDDIRGDKASITVGGLHSRKVLFDPLRRMSINPLNLVYHYTDVHMVRHAQLHGLTEAYAATYDAIHAMMDAVYRLSVTTRGTDADMSQCVLDFLDNEKRFEVAIRPVFQAWRMRAAIPGGSHYHAMLMSVGG